MGDWVGASDGAVIVTDVATDGGTDIATDAIKDVTTGFVVSTTSQANHKYSTYRKPCNEELLLLYLVSATLRRLGSLRNPMPWCSLALTQDMMMKSFSRPWKASTDATSISVYNLVCRLPLNCKGEGNR